MSITRLPEIVFPLTQVNKVNEIVDVLNDNLNMYYSTTNPALTPVDGVATWTVTHNLGTENVNCSLYNGDNLVISNVSITSDNVITVSFNATTNIAQDTYKIVVISNGAGSSSGSGSYVLPTASTTTLGGVRIDGSSITINNGVISSTVDSTLSDTSTNPVQNKVIYPSLNGFLPSGTIINVKTDGSGDFTSLADAINSLTGKWSDGSITIKLGSGTFTESGITIHTLYFNIPSVIIDGTGVNSTIINNESQSGDGINIHDGGSIITFSNFTYKKPATTIQTVGAGIRFNTESIGRVKNVKITGCGQGIDGTSNCSLDLTGGNIEIQNATQGIKANVGGNVLAGSVTFTNVITAWVTETGGRINGNNYACTYTSVTNKVSQTVGTATNNGWITGISV